MFDSAISVLDSTAKLEAGILVGNLVSMGNFDECIGVTDVQTDLGPFRGKHCLASLTWANDTFLSTKKLFALIKVVSVQVIWASLTNYVALVCERTIPTERPPHVGEVSANFCEYTHSQKQNLLHQ
jgi:hypothetical protein